MRPDSFRRLESVGRATVPPSTTSLSCCRSNTKWINHNEDIRSQRSWATTREILQTPSFAASGWTCSTRVRNTKTCFSNCRSTTDTSGMFRDSPQRLRTEELTSFSITRQATMWWKPSKHLLQSAHRSLIGHLSRLVRCSRTDVPSKDHETRENQVREINARLGDRHIDDIIAFGEFESNLAELLLDFRRRNSPAS